MFVFVGVTNETTEKISGRMARDYFDGALGAVVGETLASGGVIWGAVLSVYAVLVA